MGIKNAGLLLVAEDSGMDEPVPLMYMLGVPVAHVRWIAKKNTPNTKYFEKYEFDFALLLFICLLVQLIWAVTPKACLGNYTARYSFVIWAFLCPGKKGDRQRASPNARGYKARPRGSRARACVRARSRWSRRTKQSSLRRFHSGFPPLSPPPSLYRLQAGSECRRRREILRWGGKNGFTASLISLWTLDQGCRGLKTTTTTTNRQELAVLIKHRVELDVLCLWPFTVASQRLVGGINDRHVVTKKASVKKVDIESVEGIISFDFRPLSIVVSPFCWLLVLGDMAEQSYSWWVRIRPNGHATISSSSS